MRLLKLVRKSLDSRLNMSITTKVKVAIFLFFNEKMSYNKTVIEFNFGRHYTIIDFNEVDMRIYLPDKVIIHRGR